jgi:hypothetical protein
VPQQEEGTVLEHAPVRQNNSIARATAEPTIQVRGSHDCFEKRTEDGALSFRAHRAIEATHRFNWEIPSRSVFAQARENLILGNRLSFVPPPMRRRFAMTSRNDES